MWLEPVVGDAMAKQRVNLRVDEDTKREWDEYVEESAEYSSLSQLIRAVVNAEVRTDDRDGPSDSDRESSEGSDPTEWERLDEKLDNMEAQLREIREGQTVRDEYVGPPEEREPRHYPAESEVFEMLPEGEGPSDGMTPDEIAEASETEYGGSLLGHTVRLLEQKSGRVKTHHDGEKSVFWKEV